MMLANLKRALEQRDRAAVNHACRALIDAQPAIGSQWRAVALVLLENGEMADARRAADLLVRAAGGSPLSRFVQAEIYARTGRVTEADTILRDLPEDIPDPRGNAYVRGTVAMNIGDIDEARRQLRRAVTLAPESGQSWLALAMVGRMTSEDGERLVSLRSQTAAAPPVERGAYFYALGKFLHEQGDADGAFASYATGAAIEAERRPAAARSAATSLTDGWTEASLARVSRPTKMSARPVFVTGLPRSGTTLVEQILTAHSSFDGGEELGFFRHLIREVNGDVTYPAVTNVLEQDRGDSLVALYDHLLTQRFPGVGRVVDKSLLASRHMALIATLFPDAPVVWMRRNPLDNAWSIFRTYFLADLGWTFDLANIAAEMEVEDRLFAHWTQLRPQQILPVRYEELVQSPEQVIARIVEHCGVALEPQQLVSHQSARAVVTASVTQVREPINQRAIGAAEPYRRHLQPFLDAYLAP